MPKNSTKKSILPKNSITAVSKQKNKPLEMAYLSHF
nr:MAG TPA: hypothetical protein [Caudoviricetes sp.]